MSTSEDVAKALRRLDRIAGGTPPGDRQLGLVAFLANADVPLAIGLLVGGVQIRGQVTSERRYVEVLQSAADSMVSALMRGQDDAIEVLQHAFLGQLEQAAEWEKSDREVAERYVDDPPHGLDDVSVDDLPAFLRAQSDPAHLHLRDANVTQGTESVTLRAVRIRVSEIAAWWPLEVDSGVTLDYGEATSPGS